MGPLGWIFLYLMFITFFSFTIVDMYFDFKLFDSELHFKGGAGFVKFYLKL